MDLFRPESNQRILASVRSCRPGSLDRTRGRVDRCHYISFINWRNQEVVYVKTVTSTCVWTCMTLAVPPNGSDFHHFVPSGSIDSAASWNRSIGQFPNELKQNWRLLAPNMLMSSALYFISTTSWTVRSRSHLRVLGLCDILTRTNIYI